MNRLESTSRQTLVDTSDLAKRLPNGVPVWILESLLQVTGLSELNQAYATLGTETPLANPFQRALDCLRIRTLVNQEELSRIPRTGPTILVANHPFGGADGLALGALALECRKDVRVLVNSWLEQVDVLRPFLIPVDVFESRRNALRNVSFLRGALRHLRQGGLLIVFPAGTVSQLNPASGRIDDVAWNVGIATLARLSAATVVPCYFEGHNRALFHLAGLLHSSLRTALLPRELVAKQYGAVRLSIGRQILPSDLEQFDSDHARIAWLRLRTYALESASEPQGSVTAQQLPLAPTVPQHQLVAELSKLPKECTLLEQGPYRVFFATAFQIPKTLEEIGRLREQSFRAVGEGTGKPADLDRFDRQYHHLVLWDDSTQRIVGAYRLAFCDQRLRARGFDGLYSHTLFRYRDAIRPQLMTSIELGRSFIRPEYQRKPLPLALLFRGIGEVLLRHPAYRTLIGPVSISKTYRGPSQRLLLHYLKSRTPPLAWRNAAAARRGVSVKLSEEELKLCAPERLTPKALSSLICHLDPEGKRIPVLVERYLEMGAQILDISRDPSFGNCIDALVVVELDCVPLPLLKRFLGAEGAERMTELKQLAS